MNTFATLLKRVRKKRNNLILKIYPQRSRSFCSCLLVSTVLLPSVLLPTFPCYPLSTLIFVLIVPTFFSFLPL